MAGRRWVKQTTEFLSEASPTTRPHREGPLRKTSAPPVQVSPSSETLSTGGDSPLLLSPPTGVCLLLHQLQPLQGTNRVRGGGFWGPAGSAAEDVVQTDGRPHVSEQLNVSASHHHAGSRHTLGSGAHLHRGGGGVRGLVLDLRDRRHGWLEQDARPLDSCPSPSVTLLPWQQQWVAGELIPLCAA